MNSIPTRPLPAAVARFILCFALMAAIVGTLVAMSGCTQAVPARDDSDPPGGASGMMPMTDSKTGCQYLVVANGWQGISITPRMGADGRQLCTGGTQ